MTKEHSLSPTRTKDCGLFGAALAVVREVLHRRISRDAQESLARDIVCVAVRLRSASLVDQLFLSNNEVARIQSIFHHSQRFRHLDLLSVGEDHVFIVHRALLMQDIQDYLSGSNKYLLRVFVNVDHRLSKPALLPGNRCHPLEDYITNVLRPEIELRLQTWDEAERTRAPLPVPRDVSLVTLTGWMLTYPIIYVIPKNKQRSNTGRMYNYKTIDNDDDDESDEDIDEDEDEEDDLQGRNCLANLPLVVTRIKLEPNHDITGLREHAFMSFSFPANLDPPPNIECDDGCHSGGDESQSHAGSPPPANHIDHYRHHPARTNSTSTQGSISSCNSGPESVSSPLTITPADCERFYPDDDDIECAVLSPRSPDGIAVATKSFPFTTTGASSSKSAAAATTPIAAAPLKIDTKGRTSPRQEQQQQQQQQQRQEDGADGEVQEGENEACVFAAGRSFLHQLHVRFQQQKIWSTWQVGQETVTLPIVAM